MFFLNPYRRYTDYNLGELSREVSNALGFAIQDKDAKLIKRLNKERNKIALEIDYRRNKLRRRW
jgi:hypothetical protein